jgi:hypothetical protein
VDESAINCDTTKDKVLVVKNSPYFEKVTKTEHITLVSCISANGTAMRNMLIFTGTSIPEGLNLYQYIVSTNPSGWMDTNTKATWFNYFLEYIGNAGKEKKDCKTHLLLVDGHSSNWSDIMIENAKNHNVIIFHFPAHLTHVISSFFSS